MLLNRLFLSTLTTRQLHKPFSDWFNNKEKDIVAPMIQLKPEEAVYEKEFVSKYFIEKETTKNHHTDNAIKSMKDLIKSNKWELGGFGLFKGGVPMELDGQKLRLPHRVAAIAKLIKDYESSENNASSHLLYEQIKARAQEAINTPRTAQKRSTKNFYQNIIDNAYVAEKDIEDNAETPSMKYD